MQYITANLSASIRRDVLNGREHIVAPMVSINPGVLSGTQGPLFYPPDEVARDPAIWNGVPITLRHPTRDGQPTSARDPDVLNKQGIGVVLRSEANGKLRHEAWIDVENAKRLAPDVLKALEAGKPIEVSTGLFTENEPTRGVHNGREYIAIARNYKPDHVAILPDQVGACSVNDGCGLMVNQDADTEQKKTIWRKLGEALGIVANEPSYGNVNRQLQSAVADRFGGMRHNPEMMPFVKDVFNDHFIYHLGDKLYRLNYSVNETDQIELSNEAPVEVVKQVNYQPVTNEAKPMADTKQTTVDYLIANCECWQESDRETLNAFTDEKLGALKKHVDDHKAQVVTLNELKAKVEPKPEEKPAKPGAPVANESKETPPAAKPVTTEQWLQSAPPEVKSAVENAMRVEADEKQKLVTRLVANLDESKRDERGKALMNRSLAELNEMVEYLPAPAQTPRQPSYLGADAGQVTNTDDDGEWELMVPPVMNYEEIAKRGLCTARQ